VPQIAPERPFRLRFEPDPVLNEAAFRCEADAFRVHYNVSYSAHVAEFAPYRDYSSFLAVYDHHDRAVGVLRLIRPNPLGLKTLAEVAGPPWSVDALAAAEAVGLDPLTTWDVATLAVPRASSNRPAIVAALYHGLVRVAEHNDVRSLVMNLDIRVRSVLAMMGLLADPIPGVRPMPFCGSQASQPTYAHRDQMLDTQRRVNPEAYRLITEGSGLDDVQVPPGAEFVVGWRSRPSELVASGRALPGRPAAAKPALSR
jgi:hypothetical protein